MTRIFIVYTVVRQAPGKTRHERRKTCHDIRRSKGQLWLYQFIKRVHSSSITLDLPSYI